MSKPVRKLRPTSVTPPADDPLESLARLVAAGTVHLPDGLPPEEHERLVARVRSIRREELLEFVARTLALAIHAKAHRESSP